MRETQVRSLGWEDPLEKGMATHFSNLAWRIPWTEKPGVLQSMGHKKSDMTEQLTHTHTHTPFPNDSYQTHLRSVIESTYIYRALALWQECLHEYIYITCLDPADL